MDSIKTSYKYISIFNTKTNCVSDILVYSYNTWKRCRIQPINATMSIDEVVKHFGKGYKNIKIMTPEEFFTKYFDILLTVN